MKNSFRKFVVRDNKLISVFDVVRFITSDLHHRLSANDLKKYDDYHLILTHGVSGDLIGLIEYDFYGVNKNKITVLCNNIEAMLVCQKAGVRSLLISEYIFTDDDENNILTTEQEYDCIFPGRPGKDINLFNRSYKNINFLIVNRLKEFPIPRENMPMLYNKSKCGLMTTNMEGSCCSVAEMLACGIPVVTVKILDNISTDAYYGELKYDPIYIYQNYYIQFPNTLGGRELWLNNTNSIYCERNDDSIENAIHTLNSMNLNRQKIRSDFISMLRSQREQFMYVVKNACDYMKIKFDFPIEDVVNLPYGNNSVKTVEWKNIIDGFDKKFDK
jgi:glycosyltransferase involved in cell wall biosynthesis